MKMSIHKFVPELELEILSAIQANDIQSIDDVWDWIHQSVENACIYYADCFDIIKELNYIDWSESEFGTITNVSEAAFDALYTHIQQEIDIDSIEKAIEEYEQE